MFSFSRTIMVFPGRSFRFPFPLFDSLLLRLLRWSRSLVVQSCLSSVSLFDAGGYCDINGDDVVGEVCFRVVVLGPAPPGRWSVPDLQKIIVVVPHRLCTSSSSVCVSFFLIAPFPWGSLGIIVVTSSQVKMLITFRCLKWRKTKLSPFLVLGIFHSFRYDKIRLSPLSWWRMYSKRNGSGTDLNCDVCWAPCL